MQRLKAPWILSFIAVLILIQVVLTQYEVQKLHEVKASRYDQLAASTPMALYVPSPFELSMIKSERNIWPRAYGPQSPPELGDIPRLYSLFQRQHKGQGDDTGFFRSLAMTSTLGEWDAFKEMISFRVNPSLPELTIEALWAWILKEKCSLYGKEIAYRV